VVEGSRSQVLALNEFLVKLSELTKLAFPHDPDCLLLDIQGFDSLAAFSLLVILEDEFGADVPIALWDTMATIGDIYLHYVTRWDQDRG
jgi:acyl carrier protein